MLLRTLLLVVTRQLLLPSTHTHTYIYIYILVPSVFFGLFILIPKQCLLPSFFWALISDYRQNMFMLLFIFIPSMVLLLFIFWSSCLTFLICMWLMSLPESSSAYTRLRVFLSPKSFLGDLHPVEEFCNLGFVSDLYPSKGILSLSLLWVIYIQLRNFHLGFINDLHPSIRILSLSRFLCDLHLVKEFSLRLRQWFTSV